MKTYTISKSTRTFKRTGYVAVNLEHPIINDYPMPLRNPEKFYNDLKNKAYAFDDSHCFVSGYVVIWFPLGFNMQEIKKIITEALTNSGGFLSFSERENLKSKNMDKRVNDISLIYDGSNNQYYSNPETTFCNPMWL